MLANSWSTGNYIIMEKCRIVLTDMDGVLADFDGEVIRRMRKKHPDIPILDSRQKFYISDDYPEYSNIVRQLSDEPGFFESLPCIENAVEGWKRIIELGYDPQICSSPMLSNPNSGPEKLIWLREHFAPIFGCQAVDRAIITREKYIHDSIAIIDDNPKLPRADEASWTHIIYDQPYNQYRPGPRLKGWLDDKLPSLLESAMKNYRKKF